MLAGDAEDVAQLLLVGVVHFVEALELGRVTGLDAQLLLGQRILAVVEHQFHDLGQAGLVFLGDEAALAADAGGHAAVVAAVAGVFQGDAAFVLGEAGQVALDDHVVVQTKPGIIAEKYMEDQETGELRDYKFFCFNGEPKLMFVATERGVKNTKFDFYDMQFNHMNIVQHYPNSVSAIRKPEHFEKMIELTKKLSEGFPHVRVDFYEANGQVYFGEMTFYHFGAIVPFETKEWDKKIGDWLVLPEKIS